MEANPDVKMYIADNGGKEAFEPEENPDSFLELMQVIAVAHSNGDEEVAASFEPEELESYARWYLGLPPKVGHTPLV